MIDTVDMLGEDGKTYSFPSDKVDSASKAGFKVASPTVPAPPAAKSLADEHKVEMVGEDGKHYEFPVSKAFDAHEAGFRHLNAVEQHVSDHPIESGISSFIHGADVGMTGGALGKASSLIAGETPEQKAGRLEVEHEQQEQHPIAKGAGEVAGFVAPMGAISKVGGAVGKATTTLLRGQKALEAAELTGTAADYGLNAASFDALKSAVRAEAPAGFGAQLAGNVANMGTQGALVAAPSAAVDAYQGNTARAAEGLLIGAGLGSATGLVGGLGEKLLRNVASRAAPAVEDMALNPVKWAQRAGEASETAQGAAKTALGAAIGSAVPIPGAGLIGAAIGGKGAVGSFIRRQAPETAEQVAKRELAGDIVASMTSRGADTAATERVTKAAMEGRLNGGGTLGDLLAYKGLSANAVNYTAKFLMEHRDAVTGLASSLRQAATDPIGSQLGGRLMMAADSAIAQGLAKIPSAVMDLSDKGTSSSPAMKADSQDDFKKYSTDLKAAATNPQQFISKTAAIADALSHDKSTQKVATQFQVNAYKATQYLYAQMPKPPQVMPFAKKQDWQPSPAELTKFTRVKEVVSNPLSVIDRLREGNLQKYEVDALNATAPEIAKSIQKAAFEMATKGEDTAELSRPARQQLGLLAGFDLDPLSKPDAAKQIQSQFGSSSPPQSSNAPGSKPKRGSGSSLKLSNTGATQSQMNGEGADSKP